MTRNDDLPGRPVSQAPALTLACTCLLSLASLPVFAGPGLAADSGDQVPVTASVVHSVAPEMLRLANRDQLETPAQAEPEGRVQRLLKGAMSLLGTPYRWGGTSPDGGFDCSGLVNYVFRTALGIELPRVSRDMARDGERVDRDALSAGDLVFFSRRGSRIDHVGIYLGDGRFVHAPRTGKDVMVSELDTGYWSRKFMQARRIAGV